MVRENQHCWRQSRRSAVFRCGINPNATLRTKTLTNHGWQISSTSPGPAVRSRALFSGLRPFRDLADFLDDVALCDPGRLKYHGGHILNTLSHGEGMLSYFNGRFNMKGLYFLDEPEAALSPSSQVKFLSYCSSFLQLGRRSLLLPHTVRSCWLYHKHRFLAFMGHISRR